MIDILMATYNGASYIEVQLKSLFAQSYTDWKLIIRDDGSTDDTLDIIKDFSDQFPEKILLLNTSTGHLGSTLSFAELLTFSTSQYIMFCDQDDFWFKDKIAQTLSEMLKLEQDHPRLPLLVFTDLTETDGTLNVTSKSFIKSQKLFPEIANDPNKLLALNVVAGCTMMINSISKDYVLPMPSSNVVHDHWISVNVAYFGKIKYLPFPTIFYRQHRNNAVGSYKIGSSYFITKFIQPFKQFKIYRSTISNLKFKVNYFHFIYYKLFFIIKRLNKV